MVVKPGKHQTSKQRCQDLCWEVLDPAQFFLFCAYILCMIYATKTFLLASFSVQSKQILCFVHSQGQEKQTKTYNKEICRIPWPFPSINYAACNNDSVCATVESDHPMIIPYRKWDVSASGSHWKINRVKRLRNLSCKPSFCRIVFVLFVMCMILLTVNLKENSCRFLKFNQPPIFFL